MGALINGIDTNRGTQRTLDRRYEFTPFPYTDYALTLSSGEEVKFNVKGRISAAWGLIAPRAQDSLCNQYFRTLARGKSLREVLEEGDIIVHYLAPKNGYSVNDLPAAASGGRHIGLSLHALLPKVPGPLACTFIHELAHVAGASIEKTGPKKLEAETALKHCQCASQFNAENLGVRILDTGVRFA